MHDGRVELKLAKPLKVDVTEEGGWWHMTNQELRLVATAPTERDCQADFEAEFIFVHRVFGLENDFRLSGDAQALKRRVLSYLARSE